MARIGRAAAETSVKNVAAIFALAGLVFYLVGLARRVAILEAEGLPTSQGIPLTSLQDYLVQGLAVIIDPATLEAIALWLAVIGAILLSPAAVASLKEATAEAHNQRAADQASDGKPPDDAAAPSAARPRRLHRLGIGLFLLATGLAVLCITAASIVAILYLPPGAWAPPLASLLVAAAMVALYKLRAFNLPRWEDWTHGHARLVVGTVLGMLLAYALATLALAPPPLDAATLHLKSGKERHGRLLANTNGAIYLADPAPAGQAAEIDVVPLGVIKSVEITEGEPRRYASLAHLLGWTDERWPTNVSNCDPFPGAVQDLCDWAEDPLD